MSAKRKAPKPPERLRVVFARDGFAAIMIEHGPDRYEVLPMSEAKLKGLVGATYVLVEPKRRAKS